MVGGSITAFALVLLRNILRDHLPRDISPESSGVIVSVFLLVLLYGILTRRIFTTRLLAIKILSFGFATTGVRLIAWVGSMGQMESETNGILVQFGTCMIAVPIWIWLQWVTEKYLLRDIDAVPSRVLPDIARLSQKSLSSNTYLKECEGVIKSNLDAENCQIYAEFDAIWLGADSEQQIPEKLIRILRYERSVSIYSLERTRLSQETMVAENYLNGIKAEIAIFADGGVLRPRVIIFLGPRSDGKLRTFLESDYMTSVGEAISLGLSFSRLEKHSKNLENEEVFS